MGARCRHRRDRSLAGHVTDLTAALRGAVTAEAAAKTNLAENRDQLTQIGREHAAVVARNAELDRQVVDLAARTIATTGRATDLQRDLGQIEKQAAKAGTERDEAIRSRDFMAKLVDDLQYRLADLKESQVDLVMRLRNRADASVAAAEAVVRHTGLNIDLLLSNARPPTTRGESAGHSFPWPTLAAAWVRRATRSSMPSSPWSKGSIAGMTWGCCWLHSP